MEEQYFLSFVEAVIQNKNYQGYRGGRIEVYDNETDYPYACEEISFLTDKVDEYLEFQDKYDFEDVDEETLDKVRDIATRRFNENKES